MVVDSHHIPWPYRALFLYFEPFMALFGTFICFAHPAKFLNTMSPTATYVASSQVIFDQLGATYALFAFNEAVVLRVAKDLRTWKAIIRGILLCDAIHLYANYAVVGSELFFDIRLWRWEDWFNFGSLWGQALIRAAFLMGIGVYPKSKNKKTA